MLILEGGQGLYYVILIDRTVVVTHTIRDTTTIPMTYGYILNDNRNWSPRWPAFSPSLAFLVSNDLIIKIIGDSEKLAMAKTVGFLPATWWVNHRSRDDFFFFRSEFHQRQSSQRAWEKKRLAPNSDEFSWFSPWFNSSVTCFFSTQMFRTSTFVSAYQIAGSPSRSMYFPYDPTMKFSMKWLGEFLPTRVMRDPWDHWSLDGDEYHYHC